MRRLFLSSLSVNLFVRFLNVWTGILGARFLGPYGRGELAAATRWSSLFVVLFTIGLPGAVIFYGKLSKERQGEYVGAYLVVGTFFGMLGFLVGELMIPYLFHEQSPHLVHLAEISMLSIPFGVVADGFIGTLLTVNAFGKVLWVRVLGEIGTFLVIISLVILGKYTVGYFIVVNLIWSILIFMYTAFLIARSIRVEFHRLWTNVKLLSFKGIHIYSASIVGMFGTNIDQLVISLFLTPYTLGLYAVGASLGGMLPAILSGALSNYLWPKLMDMDTEQRLIKVETIHGVLFYGSFVIAICAGATLPILLPLAYGRDFGPAVLMTELILLSTPLQVGGSVLSYLLSTSNRFTTITVKEVVGLVCGLVVTVPLLHVWEGVGAALGFLAANIAKWILLSIVSKGLGLRIHVMLNPHIGSFVSLFKGIRSWLPKRRVAVG